MPTETRLSATLLLSLGPLIWTCCGGTFVSDPTPEKRVVVNLSKRGYISGDTVVLTVKNVSALTLTYPVGFCKTELQRQVGPTWITVPLGSNGCPLALRILGARQSVVHEYVLPSSLPTGLYRLAIPTPIPGNAKTTEPPLTTPAFTVNSVALAP